MELQYTENKVTKRTVKTVPFYKNFVKVFENREIYINGVLDKTISEVFITTEDKLANVKALDRISDCAYVEHFYGQYARVRMLSKDTYDDLLHGKKYVYDNGVFEDYDDVKYMANTDNYMLVLWNQSSYELADLDGVYLPVAVHCSYDYSGGRITNANYDLQEIVEKLNKDNRVFSIQTDRYKADYGKVVPLKIIDIPYYNANEYEYQQVDFYIIPTSELYNEMKAIENDFDRVPYLLEKMFGIKKKN